MAVAKREDVTASRALYTITRKECVEVKREDATEVAEALMQLERKRTAKSEPCWIYAGLHDNHVVREVDPNGRLPVGIRSLGPLRTPPDPPPTWLLKQTVTLIPAVLRANSSIWVCHGSTVAVRRVCVGGYPRQTRFSRELRRLIRTAVDSAFR